MGKGGGPWGTIRQHTAPPPSPGTLLEGLRWEKLSPGDDDESYVWSVIEGEPAFKWVGENTGGGGLSKRDSEDSNGETGEKSESPWENKANKQYEVEKNL